MPRHEWGSTQVLLMTLVIGPHGLQRICPLWDHQFWDSCPHTDARDPVTASTPQWRPRPLHLAAFPPLGSGHPLLGATPAQRPRMSLLSDSARGLPGSWPRVGCRALLIITHQRLRPTASLWASFSSYSKGTLLRLGDSLTGSIL